MIDIDATCDDRGIIGVQFVKAILVEIWNGLEVLENSFYLFGK